MHTIRTGDIIYAWYLCSVLFAASVCFICCKLLWVSALWADCCPALSSARRNEGAGRVCSTLYLLHCVVCECGGRGVSVFSPVCNLLSLQCTGVQFMSANGGCLSFLQCADYSVFAVAVHECCIFSPILAACGAFNYSAWMHLQWRVELPVMSWVICCWHCPILLSFLLIQQPGFFLPR